MNTLCVTFIGHKEIYDHSVQSKVENIVRQLVCDNEYVEFLIGRNGEFDTICASAVKTMQKAIRGDNSSLCLVLPYMPSDIEYYEQYYNEIILPDELHGLHFKTAIQARNRYMIDRSDVIICYVGKKSGGAYQSLRYAETLRNKQIINIFE